MWYVGRMYSATAYDFMNFLRLLGFSCAVCLVVLASARGGLLGAFREKKRGAAGVT